MKNTDFNHFIQKFIYLIFLIKFNQKVKLKNQFKKPKIMQL